MTKFIGIVASTSEQLKIGHDGKLPWHIPEDLAHFRRITMGQTVVMGRKTYEGLPKPLDGREVIVLGKGYHSIGQAWDKILTRDVVYIAGGKQIYELFLPFISEWYWTEVLVYCEGDARICLDFPGDISIERLGEVEGACRFYRIRVLPRENSTISSAF